MALARIIIIGFSRVGSDVRAWRKRLPSRPLNQRTRLGAGEGLGDRPSDGCGVSDLAHWRGASIAKALIDRLGAPMDGGAHDQLDLGILRK
jgi:hypothetical protein